MILKFWQSEPRLRITGTDTILGRVELLCIEAAALILIAHDTLPLVLR